MPSLSWCFMKACLASVPPLRSDEMSRSTLLSDFDEMSAMSRFMTSVNAIFSISKLAARRTNMMTSPVGGFRWKLRSALLTETTSSPIRSSARVISSSAYAFCSPLTSSPALFLTL